MRASWTRSPARSLAALGADRALVVASEDGLDEISIAAGTSVVEVNGEEITRYTLLPDDVGVALRTDEELERDCAGGTPEQNAAVTRMILGLERPVSSRPAALDLAVINAGAAIYVAGAADSIADGVQAARSALAEESAAQALESYVQASLARAPSQAAR